MLTHNFLAGLLSQRGTTGGGGGTPWILATGFWNDAGVWDDTAFWID